MKRLLPILILLVAVESWADTPISVQSRNSWETGTEWQYVDTTSLLSSTEGALISSWSLSAADATNRFKYSTTRPYLLPRRYTVPGVITNAADTGTRNLVVIMEVTTAERYLQANLAATQGKLAGGFGFENNFTTADFSNCDFFKFHNGVSDAVIQYRSYSPLAYRTHTGSPSLVGPDIAVTSSQTNVWITFKFDNSAGVTNFSFSVYDRDNRELIGSSAIALTGASYPNVADIRISNDSHSSASVQRTNRVDNFLLTTNVSDYPIIPWLTNVYYVDKTNGSDSNSGRSAAKAWATLTKAEATIGAGETAFIAAGTYDEAVTFDASGTAGNLRKFIAATNVVCRNFIVTGSYQQLSGFEFTKIGVNTNVTPVVVNDCTGVELIDNYFHDTGHGTSGGEGGGLRYGNATNFIVRGNTFLRCGVNGETGTPTNAKDIADYNAKLASTNVLIEYNNHSHSAEYMNLSGTNTLIRNGVFGPTDGSDWSGTPHIDVLQLNSMFRMGGLVNNWHNDNTNTDAHFYLAQYGYSADMRITGNVIRKVGDPQAIWIGLSAGTTSNHFVAHNIIANTRAYEGTPSTAEPIYFHTTTNNWAGNNIFTNCTTDATPYDLSTDGYVNKLGGDIMFSQGTSNELLNVSNPQWVDYTGNDFRPQTTSPAKDMGVRLTGTTAAGSSSTSVAVTNSVWFTDGFGLTLGDYIYVGANNNVLVTGINRSTHTLTVSAAISWSAGDAVGYAYRGSGPDIGAYEFGDTLLASATISSNASVYTVTPTGDARMVVFYADGIPQAPIFDSPYTYTATGGEAVTAKAYALRAQAVPVVAAASGAGDVTAPTCAIASPTSVSSGSSGSYSTSSSTITVSGTSGDATATVTWSNSRGGAGTATGSTSWSQAGITLASGGNVLTFTATDPSANATTTTLNVTYTAPASGGGSTNNVGTLYIR